MNIIIVGCGKVGRELAAQLSKDNNDVTIVDIDPDLVRNVSTLYDVMGVTGNGTSFEVLAQAGVDQADALIATTRKDEVNLLCCVMARKASKCRTIARVSNPIYSREDGYLSRELGITMIYNPAYGAAREVASLFNFPSALDIFTFAKNKADVIRFRVPVNSPLKGTALKNLPPQFADRFLICIAERDKKIIIPDGNYVISAGDILSVVTYPDQINSFFPKLGLRTDRIKNVLIVGGSKMTFYLTRLLAEQGMKVTLIEKNRARAEELAEMIPDITVLCGDGTDWNFLREEHLDHMDALLASTNNDEENIILSLFSRGLVRYKIVTKVDHLDDASVIDRLDLDSIVSPKLLMTEAILKYIRATGNSEGSNVERLYRMVDGSVEAIEFLIHEGAPVIGERISKLPLKPSVLVAGIVREGRLILPTGMDEIKAGDSVIIMTTQTGFRDIKDILQE